MDQARAHDSPPCIYLSDHTFGNHTTSLHAAFIFRLCHAVGPCTHGCLTHLCLSDHNAHVLPAAACMHARKCVALVGHNGARLCHKRSAGNGRGRARSYPSAAGRWQQWQHQGSLLPLKAAAATAADGSMQDGGPRRRQQLHPYPLHTCCSAAPPLGKFCWWC